jgi:hydroxyethylthiazole kinase
MPAEESEMAEPQAAAPAPMDDLAIRAAHLLQRLRVERRRVHAITNGAAQVFTANLLLAAGATPSLTTSPDEVPAFAARADALLINLGTLDAERRAAIPWAIAVARAAHRPWVLDPVFVDLSPPRLDIARLSLTGCPSVVRCNATEFEALAGASASLESARAFARDHGLTVALTGARDLITDGDHAATVENGHPLMAQITAMGCATTALVAAFASMIDAFTAATAGLLLCGIAGEIASETARGPGTFQAAFLDALFSLDEAAVAGRARIT